MLAHTVRLLLGLGGGILAIAVIVWADLDWKGWIAGFVLFALSGWAAEKSWRLLATRTQIQQDLEHRARTPPD